MTFYADAHVHLYACFDLVRLLRAASRRARDAGGPLLLLLSECHGHDRFGALAHVALHGVRGFAEVPPDLVRSFPPKRTGEEESLRLGDVVLVAGRQLVSREAVEVLALAAPPSARLADLADRSLGLRELVTRVVDAGALAVLPWGVGKWLGARGHLVADLAAEPDIASDPAIFAGDIAQRCWPWPTPHLFDAPLRVLPGSDVLPVPGAERRTAGYGFSLDAPFDPERPAASLRAALRGGARPRPWGRREGLASTLVEQLRYRLARGAA